MYNLLQTEPIFEKIIDNPENTIKIWDAIGGLQGFIYLGLFFVSIYIALTIVRNFKNMIVYFANREKEKKNQEIEKINAEAEKLKQKNIDNINKQNELFLTELKNTMAVNNILLEKMQISISINKLEMNLDSYLGIDQGYKQYCKSKIMDFIDIYILTKQRDNKFTNLYAELDIHMKQLLERLQLWTFQNKQFYNSIEKECRKSITRFLNEVDDIITENENKEDLKQIIINYLDDIKNGLPNQIREIKKIIINNYNEHIIKSTNINYSKTK